METTVLRTGLTPVGRRPLLLLPRRVGSIRAPSRGAPQHLPGTHAYFSLGEPERWEHEFCGQAQRDRRLGL